MASLRNLAELAQVSIRTVARVLNNDANVRAETRTKVLKAVDELGYRPNRLARGLKRQKSFEIVVILSNFDELHMEKVQAMEEVFRMHDYSLSMVFDKDNSSRDVPRAMEDVCNRRPAGVVVMSRPLGKCRMWMNRLEEEEVPVIFVDSDSPDVPSPKVDRARGICDAVLHLSSAGRKRIAYVGPANSTGRGNCSRLQGYMNAMKIIGGEPVIVDIAMPGDMWTLGYNSGRDFLKLSPRPDAVQMFSDEMALAFMACMHDHGLRIPQDVAVMGFDDRHSARFSYPPLSTVRQPNAEIGRCVGELLLKKINNSCDEKEDFSPLIPPSLVIRSST